MATSIGTKPIDVLVVDDSDSDAELTLRALSGFSCFRLADGEQAVDFILHTGLYRETRAEFPRLMLLDIELPRVNGFDVLQEVRAHYSAEQLPIVMFTGSSNEYLEARCLELGANQYVTKPSTYDAYASRLREAVSRWLPSHRSIAWACAHRGGGRA